MRMSRLILCLSFISLLNNCSQKPELNEAMMYTNSTSAVNETLGLSRDGEQNIIRVYGPELNNLNVILFKQVEDSSGQLVPMRKKANGVWQVSIRDQELTPYYALQSTDFPGKTVADPYSRAVARQNFYWYPSKTVVLPEDNFNWEGERFTHTKLKDMVILEAHLRDMTAHSSSGSTEKGTFKGFITPQQRGGIQHLLDMGYNTIEFLPLQEFGNIEINYKNPDLSIWNDWNPYENNHWGYMTSFFFAPELYYASDGTSERGQWMGADGRAVTEMKEMVKQLHKKGISVIMDVVYNHVAQYEDNPFKLIDKDGYFRLDEAGDYMATSGCGNDFKTENPMSRKLIVESVRYWMEEFHIDGFRFDLAALIDFETIDEITRAAQAINPDVVLIAEPWGGGMYNPAELADHGWASWNDHFRNSVKGRNPTNGDYGFILGKLWDGHDKTHYKKLMSGYLQKEGGHYIHPSQSVNYLESHDDYTLGDFIRLALERVGLEESVTREAVATLSTREIQIHKLAALALMTSQGPVMLAQGQSWGRAKVIANIIGTDPQAGRLDHNSYEKDDETNWLNWDEKELNSELVDYYRGLVAIRETYPELRRVEAGIRTFIKHKNDHSFGFLVKGDHQVMVLLNGSLGKTASYDLPAGKWQILADAAYASTETDRSVANRVDVLAQSGMILIQ